MKIHNQLTLDLTAIAPPPDPAPEHLMVGDRVKRSGDPHSIYEIAEIAAGIANLRCIACGTGRMVKDLNTPLTNLVLVSGESVPQIGSLEIKRFLSKIEATPEQDCSGVACDRPTPEHSSVVLALCWVESYPVKSRYRYYRFCYLVFPSDIRSIKRLHIGGGDISSALATCRKAEVESAIAMKKPPFEIEQLIKSWRQSK